MFICLSCTTPDDEVSFVTLKDLKVHEMTGHIRPVKELPKDPRGDHPSATELKEKKQQEVIPKVEDIHPPIPVELIPLTLKYHWEGQHAKCRDTVKTIEIELPVKNIIVAYCVRCNEKLAQQEVVPIKDQFLDTTFENFLKPKKK